MSKLSKKKIAIFTGTRAEYGLLYWIIKALHEFDDIELQLLVGGMHLSPEFGNTVTQIEADGFPISEKIEFLLSSDTPVGISKSMGLAIISAAEAIERHNPEILILLGDRYETLALAQTAMLARVPIAHIHGGEVTEGLIDEAIRHSITKMAHIHFTSTETYRRRVIQLGENPDKVFNVGAPGIDNIVRLKLLKNEELSSEIGFELLGPYFLVTYHPVTLEINGSAKSLKNLLFALDKYPEYQIIFTYPNSDTYGRQLIDLLHDYQNVNPSRVYVAPSLGQFRYLSLMKHCTAVIGNSSSGLIEAPSFKVPTVNIGNRQKGRLAGCTVVQTSDDIEEISKSIKHVIKPEFRQKCKSYNNPYGDGETSNKIISTLRKISLEDIIMKPFNDLDFL